jgi:hypothetical protein
MTITIMGIGKRRAPDKSEIMINKLTGALLFGDGRGG